MTAEQERAAVVAKGGGNWAYMIGPVWFVIVWYFDDFRGAWLSCVGMFGICLLALWEAGRNAQRKRGEHLRGRE